MVERLLRCLLGSLLGNNHHRGALLNRGRLKMVETLLICIRFRCERSFLLAVAPGFSQLFYFPSP
jgi:hypothetical protein